MMHTHTAKTFTTLVLGVLALCLALTTTGCRLIPEPPTGPEKVGRMAVVIDESASFTENLPVAAKIVSTFLKEHAMVGDVDVYLISMDRNPRVLGFYPAAQLPNKTSMDLLKEIDKTCPQDGTDVVGALRLAVQKLNEDRLEEGTVVGDKYLMVFSDMHVDRGTNPRVDFAGLESFDWASLAGCKKTYCFFVDDNLKRGDNITKVKSLLTAGGVPASAQKVVGPITARDDIRRFRELLFAE